MSDDNFLDPASLDRHTLEEHPSFASTLGNGLALLGSSTAGDPWLGNNELAAKLGLSRPTVSRLAFTLIGLGFLRRDKQTGKYQLGPAVLSLGYPLLSQLTVRQLASEDIRELARHAGGPISVGTRDRLSAVYIETTQSTETNATRPGIGSTRPLLNTAMGRALLAAHKPAEREALERRLATEMPVDWERFEPDLRQAYADIDRRGFCSVIGAWRPTLSAVAVPMRGSVAGLRIAFNLTTMSYATSEDALLNDLGPRLVEVVRRTEAKLGQH